MISTVFGITTSLGIGVMQLNYGLTYMFDVPETLTVQVILIVLVYRIRHWFFITSADSGALVLANFTSILSDVNHDAPVKLRIFWSALIGLITIALLMPGGLAALQSAVVISALPFSLVIFAVMVGM